MPTHLDVPQQRCVGVDISSAVGDAFYTRPSGRAPTGATKYCGARPDGRFFAIKYAVKCDAQRLRANGTVETWFLRFSHKVFFMIRKLFLLALLTSLSSGAFAQNMVLTTANGDFQITNTFSDVDVFNIRIEIAAPLAPGVYSNPDIVDVTYQVMGSLVPGTPSGFPAFNLERSMSGTEFYAQGSSLNFEISPTAVFSDGVQVAELVGAGVVLTFNGREIDNGRFHPALFELNADGTGRIQNSNNIHTLDPLNELDFGEEYITELMFDPGNTTVITGTVVVPPCCNVDSGGGSMSAIELYLMLALLFFYRTQRKPRRTLLQAV